MTHPLRLVEAASEHRDLSYLLDLLAPLGRSAASLARSSRHPPCPNWPEPPLRNAHADVDPLPLHRRRRSPASSPVPCSERGASGAMAAIGATLVRCLVVLAGSSRRAARPAPRLAARPLRLGARRRATTSSPPTTARPRACSPSCPPGSRQRDEHARGPSLRPPAVSSASPCSARRGGSPSISSARATSTTPVAVALRRVCGPPAEIPAGRSSAPRTASSCFAAGPASCRA